MTSLTWNRRTARVEVLRSTYPQAASLLKFYEHVLQVQASLARSARVDWVVTSCATQQEVGPRFGLRPSVDRAQVRAFRRFIGDVALGATTIISEIARRLAGARSVAGEVLEAFVQCRSLDSLAASVGCEVTPLEFFPRAFMQPAAEAVVGASSPSAIPSIGDAHVDRRLSAKCPNCARPPQVAALRDTPELKGVRTLVCSLCASEWPISRSTCPHCGEADPAKLEYHIAESWPHLRVEECRSCRVYLKAVDLRIDGAAQPLVDELASVELDLWARERGLDKLQSNLLGL